jgi:transcriptional regulator with XRE-family HTH domain
LKIDEVLSRRAAERVDLPAPEVRRAIRVANGLRLSDLAAVLSVSVPSVSRYERGHREPRGQLRRAYADALEALRRG